ncbi:MAG: hypothetical protein GYA02_18045, partial [Clostridiaceae bacterium]|nr:hypothetical protein [Clostridiaceae bacterium]
TTHDGKPAPPGGYDLNLQFLSENYETSEYYYIKSIDLTIPEGETTAEYSIQLPSNTAGSGFIFEFICSYDVNETMRHRYSFYYVDNKTTTSNKSEASLIDMSNGDMTNVNIIIPPPPPPPLTPVSDTFYNDGEKNPLFKRVLGRHIV